MKFLIRTYWWNQLLINNQITPYSSGDNYLNKISLAKLSMKKYIAFVKVMNTLSNSSFTYIVKFIKNETNN